VVVVVGVVDDEKQKPGLCDWRLELERELASAFLPLPRPAFKHMEDSLTTCGIVHGGASTCRVAAPRHYYYYYRHARLYMHIDSHF